ncbi:MAG: hypothetical protein Q8O84_01370 [Nanoarchaeota archaeon]|nr:hypothetical protein [Nanoarchaeota archaeon]
MVTTIQISDDLLNKLQAIKMHAKESYENIIWDLIEDSRELSEETKKIILDYEKEIKTNGFKNFKTLEQVKKELGF